MAVYTELTTNDLAPILLNYSIGTAVDLSPIAEGTANSNYRLTTSHGRYVCTLFELPEEATQMLWLPDYLNHLKKQGVGVVTPVADKNGSYTQTFAHKTFLISHYMRGKTAKATAATAEKAGATLGKMHLLSAQYPCPVAQPWAPEALAGFIKKIQSKQHPLYSELMAEKCWQTTNNAARLGLPEGVIHADYFPDNVMFDGQTLSGIIDFYKAGVDAFAYDLAMALTAWGFDHNGTYLPKIFAAFYEGYKSIRPLSTKEIAALPELCRRACCVILAMRLLSLERTQKNGEGARPPEAYAKRLAFFKDKTNIENLHF